ncbi:hypothetical protein Tco_0359612 [Tanacetum coccineum]
MDFTMNPNPSMISYGFDQTTTPAGLRSIHQGIIQDLRKIREELEEIKQDRRMKKENMSIEEMMREQLMVDDEIKGISNYLSYKRFRGEKIDDEYERACEIKIGQLLQDYNGLGIEIRKKERILMEEKSLAVSRRIQSICDDDDEYSIQTQEYLKKFSSTITPVLPIKEPYNSLSMGDEHLDTIPATESDEILSDSNDDDTSSDDNDFEDIKYVSLEEVNDVDQEEKEFDLEDILQIQDIILREKLLNVHRLITNIESLKNNPTPDHRSYRRDEKLAVTTDSCYYSLPEYDSFLFEIEPDQEGLISIDNSNDSLLEIPEFESFYFDDPSFPRPPPEPPDVEICLHFEPDAPVIDNFNELNDDQRGSEIDFSQNVKDDDSFTFVIRTFLPFLTYPEVSPLSCSTGSVSTILTPASPLRASGISSGWNFHVL